MARKSVYLPSPALEDGVIRITADEHHHLTVARAQPEEAVEIFDGQGNIWTAVIVSIGRRDTLARIVEHRQVERDPHEVILGQALIRAAAFEFALEKAVEIGVTRIMPFTARRSNAGAGRPDRWARIIIEAAKQSKRHYLPVVESPVRFDQIVTAEARSKIMFAERGGGPLKSALAGSPVLYLVGPEGGWTDEELDAAQRSGFALVGLGAGILRSETAAIAGAVLIRYELQNS